MEDRATASKSVSSTCPSLQRRRRKEAPQREWASERGWDEVEEAKLGLVESQPQLSHRQAGGKGVSDHSVVKATSIIQAKKFILVVKMLLCCLLSLSDSLIPKERNVPTSSQGTWLLVPTYCCCWMFLPEYVNVSIQSRHNKEKQENGNVWEKSHWSPDRSKKFCPVKLVRFVEVWKVVPEKNQICTIFLECQITQKPLLCRCNEEMWNCCERLRQRCPRWERTRWGNFGLMSTPDG